MHLNTVPLLRSAVWQAALMYLHEGDKLRIASRAISQRQTTRLGVLSCPLTYLPELPASLPGVTEGDDLQPVLHCTGAPRR